MIKLLKGYFGDDDFYLELIAQDEELINDIKKINKHIQKLAESTTTQLICNTNYHYVHPEDKKPSK